jgi:DNA-binding response OmpR family regulator
MSANSDNETRRQALEVGMDHFIAKPFNIESFKSIYGAML